MRHSPNVLLVLGLIIGSMWATNRVVAQPVSVSVDDTSSELPLPPLGASDSEIAQAPEWLVWRAFHDSVAFYDREAPDRVRDLLVERAGLTSSESAAVLAAGQGYLQRLSAIDDEARTEIRTRFQPDDSLTRNVLQRSQREGVAPPMAPDAIPLRVRDGQRLYDTLMVEGLVTRVEDLRVAAFNAHSELLARQIGAAKLSALQRWISSEVAPSVRVVTHATPVSPRSIGELGLARKTN